MEEKETINDFFVRIGKLVNQIKACGKTMSLKSLVENIFRSFIVVIAMEELEGSLEAHEQRLNERSGDKSKTEIALQEQSSKDKKDKGKWIVNRGRCNHHNFY